jgi:single-stranded DNA-specific DHH superfamily exonuclease
MTSKNLQDFKNTLKRGCFLTDHENELWDKIPDSIFHRIYDRNFNGNLALATRIILNKYDEVDAIDRVRLEKEKQKIANLKQATDKMNKYLKDGKQILFVTDNDSDGSLSQAILLEYLKLVPPEYLSQIHIEYAQPIGNSRGLTKEVVDLAVADKKWDKNEDFLIITADNGINNLEEQQRIQSFYKKSSLIITDHHLPHDVFCIKENNRTIIFNPNYKQTEYFKKMNISGANTLAVLLKNSIKTLDSDLKLTTEQKESLKNIDEISLWANLLDYVQSDIADKPVRPYIVEKAQHLQPLLNTNNSVNTLITGEVSDETYDVIKKAIPNIDIEMLKSKIQDIKLKNVFARKLLNIYKKYSVHNAGLDFSTTLGKELTLGEDVHHSINPNFIEQLRPYIFNLSAIDNKNVFMSKLNDMMVNVFEDLRILEKEIQQELRKGLLLKSEKLELSTILYPIHPLITKAFNRKFLGKTYNEENNGFLLTLDKVETKQASGSFRSLYDISDIFDPHSKEAFEKDNNIELDFQGHERAAGFFIRAKNDNVVTPEIISKVNTFINDRIIELRDHDLFSTNEYLHVDFNSIALVKKINHAVKANISNMIGLPVVVKFNNNSGVVYITDPETTEQVNLNEVVEEKKYGYQSITTDFDGGAFIVPVELLRRMVKNRYTEYLKLSYISPGVFIGNQVESGDTLKNLIDIRGGRKDEEDLLKYYRETYKDSNFIELIREDFKNIPYFKYNRYGESEFERFENFVITLLDKTNQDVLAVTDTEGTGLGKAPKCLNLGATNIQVREGSGFSLEKYDFDSKFFADLRGNNYVLTDEQMENLTPITLKEFDASLSETPNVLIKTTLSDGVSYDQAYTYDAPTHLDGLLKVKNAKETADGKVIYNREIEGFAYSFLIKDNDFKMSQEFTDLTGVSNWMLNRVGIPAASVDKRVTDYYRNLKHSDGRPKKVIFQAHNMPYDKSVIESNFQLLNELMEENLISDTAKIARTAKLAYDDTPVTNFEDVAGLPSKIYFYDSPYSEFSLSEFFADAAKGIGGVFPDRTGNYVLKYNANREMFSFIDKRENNEIDLQDTIENLIERKKTGSLPNNAVKYSVEKMSQRSMIRNILLSGNIRTKKITLTPEEKPYEAELSLFQDQFHFDSDIEKNVQNFYTSFYESRLSMAFTRDVDLSKFAERFLEDKHNKAIQAKFHDGWIYEKVLEYFEPKKVKDISNDVIDQIAFYTDFPVKKIKKVLTDVVEYKNLYNLEHAVVHEQHNNIRQKSKDGQGLSDTAYESILPQELTTTKFYNPFYAGVTGAVDRFIDLNIKGCMRQLVGVQETNKDLALDSYSVSQMEAFKRNSKTQTIQNLQKRLKEGEKIDGKERVIKFKLGGDVLAPDTGVYAQPKKHTSRDVIKEDAEKLKFIMTNEQVKYSLDNLRMAKDDRNNLLTICYANDEISKKYKEELLERYEFITFSRKEHRMKKFAGLLQEALDAPLDSIAAVRIPKGFYLNEEDIPVLKDFVEKYIKVEEKLQGNLNMESVDVLFEDVVVLSTPERNFTEVDTIRSENFLPFIDIQRRDPMKFAIGILGMEFYHGVLKQEQEGCIKHYKDKEDLEHEDIMVTPPPASEDKTSKPDTPKKKKSSTKKKVI